MENKCSKPPTSYHVPYWKYHLGGGIHHFETDPHESVGCVSSSTGAANAQSWNPSRCPSESLGLKLGLMVDTWAPIIIYCVYIYMVCGWCEYIWIMMVTGVQSPEYNLDLTNTGIQAAIGVLRTSCIIPWTLHSGGSPIGRSESGLIPSGELT